MTVKGSERQARHTHRMIHLYDFSRPESAAARLTDVQHFRSRSIMLAAEWTKTARGLSAVPPRPESFSASIGLRAAPTEGGMSAEHLRHRMHQRKEECRRNSSVPNAVQGGQGVRAVQGGPVDAVVEVDAAAELLEQRAGQEGLRGRHLPAANGHWRTHSSKRMVIRWWCARLCGSGSLR